MALIRLIYKSVSASLLILACLPLLWSCNSKSVSDEYPAPGEMRVVSVTRLERPKQTLNLIRNGSFKDWMPGSPICSGFSAPNPEFSKVFRGETGNGANLVMVQQWSRAETNSDPSTCLHTVVDALKADTEYCLSVIAESAGNVSAVLMAVERDSQGGLVMLNPDILSTLPGTQLIKQYTGTFRTQSGGTVLIGAAARSAGGKDAGIKWHEWLLFEASEKK
jgi:hypothetical protein